MAERTSKLCTLAQAAQHIPSGCRVAFGGFAVYQKPMAVVHEMIRQGIRDLTLVGCVNSIEADMLVGAGCVARLETSYVGLEKHGLAPNYRRALQRGEIEVVHYSEMLAWDRFRADREGMPFWPVYYLGGNDTARLNPDIKPFTCPVTGRQAWAVPAARPDVVVLHAWRGDKYGNIQIQPRSMLPQYLNVDMARACSTVIVTVEELVDTAEIQKNPQLTLIPAFRTTCVCHVPFGSHPTPTLGVTAQDEDAFAAYAQAAGAEDTFQAWLDRYVRRAGDFDGYLDAVGRDTLKDLLEG
jgi:glutaconate CoA-transferase subunit A